MSYTNRGFDTNHDGEGGVKIGGGDWKLADNIKLADYPKKDQQHLNKTPPPEYNKVIQDNPSIYVIGSGDFGRALAGRLAKSGYEVTVASRDAARNRYF